MLSPKRPRRHLIANVFGRTLSCIKTSWEYWIKKYVGLKISGKTPTCSSLAQFHLQKNVPKLWALVAVTLILPALAYAGTDHGKGNDGQYNGKQNGRGKMYTVPEGGPGIVLLTATVGAVLLFSTRRLRREKADRVES